ncbi:SMC-Scp complex subunit ScpB [Compostibacter hankyongensis]|uniref:SMC-Scp complex subunit ScpB n=1 Tax=Compostibacter hankyongensis TaxID=1007089 RepID=A0ABP8FIW3_9BACT
MEITQIIPHVEALIFASDRPLPALEIVELLNNALGFLEDKATLDQVEAAVSAIREKYASEFYAFDIRQSGGGYQFLTKPEYHKAVAQLNGDKYLKKLSPASLETLAIIAYKQPVSKGDVESIRGVSADYAIQKLLEKELIVIAGRNEELPGKPLLYATSRSFMDYFGLNSPADLPRIKEIFSPADAAPTDLRAPEAGAENQEGVVLNGVHLSVSEGGRLTAFPQEAEPETAEHTGTEEGTDISENGSGSPEAEQPGADDQPAAEDEAGLFAGEASFAAEAQSEEEARRAGEDEPAGEEDAADVTAEDAAAGEDAGDADTGEDGEDADAAEEEEDEEDREDEGEEDDDDGAPGTDKDNAA